MQKLVRLIIGAALIALGIWAWRALFPSPERVIRSRVLSLAKTFSYDRNEGTIAKAYNTSKLLDFFTLDVEIFVELRGYRPETINGRDDVIKAAGGARAYFPEMKVKLPDINVTLSADKLTAVANVTATISGLGDQDWIQEMNILFKLVDKRWVIYRVETVKTLTLRQWPALPVAAML